jgi:hypothetical protein
MAFAVLNVKVVNANNTGFTGVTALLAVDAGDVPIAFVAVTVNVYEVPLVKPVTVSGLDAPVAVAPSGLAVTVKPVIAEPPLSAGAEKATDTDALPGVPVTPVGASGALAPAPPIIIDLIDILS